MTSRKHHSIMFHIPGWHTATARMPRMVKSVFLDLCVYSWEHAAPVPDSAIVLMLSDTGSQGDQIVDALVKEGTLLRDDNGNVWSPWALEQALAAYAVWEKRSRGGNMRAARLLEDSPKPAALPAPADEGAKPDADKPEKPKRISAGECAEVFAAWNEVAKPLGLKGADKMTDKRQAAIRARIEENGLEKVQEALRTLPACQFVISEAKKGANWTSIDWFLRPNTITKINEGQYRTMNAKDASAWAEMDQ